MKGKGLVDILGILGGLQIVGGLVAAAALIADRKCTYVGLVGEVCRGVTTEVAIAYGVAGVVSGIVFLALGAILNNSLVLGRRLERPDA